MKNVLGLLVVAGLASSTMASIVNTNVVASVTFTNKNSVDAQGDVDNTTGSWVSTYGGAIIGVRVTGSLTEVNTATFANEAQVRLSAGSAFTAYNLTQDGTAGLAKSTWNTVTYDFVNGSSIVNGNFALGAVAGNRTPVVASGSIVAGSTPSHSPQACSTLAITSASLLVNLLARPRMTAKSQFTMQLATWSLKMMTALRAPASTAAFRSALLIRSLVILLLASTA